MNPIANPDRPVADFPERSNSADYAVRTIDPQDFAGETMRDIDDAVPQLQSCPGCGHADRVLGVPAAYLAGRGQVRQTVPRTDDRMQHTVTRQVTTALSDALAPAPKPPSYGIGCLGVLAVAVSIGTFIAGALTGHWFSDDSREPSAESPYGNGLYDPYESASPAEPDFLFLGWISALALLTAVTIFVLLAKRRATFARLMAGRPAAEQVWSRGWYCGRCGTVHFAATPGDPARLLSLQEFRERVWHAGGYGHLARRQPAVGGMAP